MRKFSDNNMRGLKKFSSVLVAVSLISSSFLLSDAQAKQARDIAHKTFPSVVMLVMQDSHGQPTSLGSGFFVKEDVVATNLHVIEGAASGYAKIVGKKPKYDIAGFVAIDRHRDLVLLNVQNVQAPTLVLADSDSVAVGDEVYAIGNPYGLEGTFSKGIVSSVRKVDEDSLLQITAPISPGSSGGPVLNAQGEVAGVSVATFKGGQNLNFAIPVSYLRPLLSRQNPRTPIPLLLGTEKKDPSIFETVGGKSTHGVIGYQFLWETPLIQRGGYSFSIQNKLRQSVKDVLCLVVFYDKGDNPIHVDLVRLKKKEVIPAGLAIRTESTVPNSVQKLTTPEDVAKPPTKVEFRILDFQIVESEDLF